jgi:hypothetical protein
MHQDDNNLEFERIRLNDYTTDGLHELVQSKGFLVKKPDSTPSDQEL